MRDQSPRQPKLHRHPPAPAGHTAHTPSPQPSLRRPLGSSQRCMACPARGHTWPQPGDTHGHSQGTYMATARAWVHRLGLVCRARDAALQGSVRGAAAQPCRGSTLAIHAPKAITQLPSSRLLTSMSDCKLFLQQSLRVPNRGSSGFLAEPVHRQECNSTVIPTRIPTWSQTGQEEGLARPQAGTRTHLVGEGARQAGASLSWI